MSDSENLRYVLEQQEKRLFILKFIWEVTRHDEEKYLHFDEVKGAGGAFGETGIAKDDLLGILKYLHDENLITALAKSKFFSVIKISHLGKVEMETTITKPNQDTSHFLSRVIIMNQTNIHAGRDAIGNISGSENKATVTNTIQTPDSDFLIQAIAELKQKIASLPQDRQSIASEAISNIEAVVSNPTLVEKAKSSLWTLWGLGQGVASFINAVTAIAERFGVDLNSNI